MNKLGAFIEGVSRKNKEEKDIPVYSVSNKGFCTEYFSKNVASLDTSSYKIVRQGEFAYNPSRINVGSVDYLRNASEALVSPLYIVFTVSEDIDKDYLLLYLKSPVVLDKINRRAKGGVRNNLKLESLKDFEINFPSLEKQKIIVNVVNSIRSIIANRENVIQKYNELERSLFFERFGDPKTNPKGIPEIKFIDLVTLQRGFDLPVSHRSGTGFPVYGSNGVLGFHSEFKSENGIITGRSGTIGKVEYCEGKFWPLNTTLFSLDLHGNNPVFIKHFMEYYDLSRFFRGSGVPTLNRNDVHPMMVMNPSLEEQNSFASSIKAIEKAKKQANFQLNKLRSLENSQIRKFFL
ncbi:MAG: restriction endonuclease subunit S [Mesosutterella sp.]|nr:restriction endonuclease subunit S [Mesosutterella sp.]